MSIPKRILRFGRRSGPKGWSRTTRGQRVAAGLNFRAKRLAYRRSVQKSRGGSDLISAGWTRRVKRATHGTWRLSERRDHVSDGGVEGHATIEERLPKPIEQLEILIPAA